MLVIFNQRLHLKSDSMNDKIRKATGEGGLKATKRNKKSVTAATPKYKNAKPRKSRNNKNQGLPVHDANILCPTEVKECLCKWPGDNFVGCRIAKPFGGKNKTWFYGSVDKYSYDKRSKEKTWHVQYDDGDAETMDERNFEYWLQQYNKLWLEELKSNSVPHREEGGKSTADSSIKKNKNPNTTTIPTKFYKISWQASKEITEFSYDAFDDCYGDEVQGNEDMYREAEIKISKTQWKEQLTNLEDANLIARDVLTWLTKRYIDEDDRGKIKEAQDSQASPTSQSKNSSCKGWRWSYQDQDEYENTFSCEGHVQVEEVIL